MTKLRRNLAREASSTNTILVGEDVEVACIQEHSKVDVLHISVESKVHDEVVNSRAIERTAGGGKLWVESERVAVDETLWNVGVVLERLNMSEVGGW